MATEPWTDMAFDPVTFERNFRQLRVDAQECYWGRYVAVNYEGTAVVADGSSRVEVRERLREMGVQPHLTVDVFVPDPNVSYI